MTTHARPRWPARGSVGLLRLALLGVALLSTATVVPPGVAAVGPAPQEPVRAAAPADDPTVIAAISDFGYAHPSTVTFADMVKGWDPEYIITTGDNVQTPDIPGNGASQYAYTVGRLFCGYLKGAAPGLGYCDSGGTASTNRFFPAAGNHDHDDGPLSGYLSYFDLPGPGATSTAPSGSELWYDVVLGDVHVFVIDSDTAWLASREDATPGQEADAAAMKAWLQDAVEDSPAAWQVVTVHEPPYGSSHDYGSTPYLQWPYASWGVDLVLNGHAAVYERVERGGITYVTNGLGGGTPTGFDAPISGSVKRVGNPSVPAEDVMGGLLMTATPTSLDVDWRTTGGTLDSFELTRTGPPEVTTTSLPDGTKGTSYDQTLAATGGAGGNEWSLAGGSLPAGLSLSSGGRIAGTPTATGRRDFTVRVTDADGGTDTRALSMTVVEPAPTGGAFAGLTPTRLLDTRRAGEGPCVSGTGGREVEVAGVGGVADDAAAVALNVTVVGAGSPGYLTVHPTGSERPVASNLNYRAGQTVPNLVTTKVGAGGKVSLFASGGCPDVLVDVAGYYTGGSAAPGGFVGITPNRVIDTRQGGTCVGGARTVTVAPSDGVPADAAAVALNVTAVDPSSQGYLTVHPSDTARPTASNVNYTAGQTVPNHVTAKVGDDGEIVVYASGGCPHVLVDVAGYYRSGTPSTGGFVGITPNRVIDTRQGGTCVGGTRTVTVAPSDGVPANAAAVALNVTAVGSSSQGYLTVFPSDAARPTASNVNYLTGQTVPNAALVRVGGDGSIRVFASGGCPHVLVDVVGYHRG